jgi:hypothetical protein
MVVYVEVILPLVVCFWYVPVEINPRSNAVTQILSSPLDPATTALLIDCLPTPVGLSELGVARRQQSALEMAGVLRPRDPVEAAMAVRIVASHYAAIDNYRCAVQPELPAPLMLGFQGRALALSRLMDTTLGALERRQTRPALRLETMPEVEGAKVVSSAPVQAEAVRAEAGKAEAEAVQAAVPPAPAVLPAGVKPSAPPVLGVPAQREAGPAKPGAKLTPVQQEMLRRELAGRSATSQAALATHAA